MRSGPRSASDPVAQAAHPLGFCAVLAAEERAAALKAVADDACAAMGADWGERAYGAFEAVEDMLIAIHQDFKRLVVVVPAGFAHRHDLTSLVYAEEQSGSGGFQLLGQIDYQE